MIDADRNPKFRLSSGYSYLNFQIWEPLDSSDKFRPVHGALDRVEAEAFHDSGQHDDHSNVLLPDHLPEYRGRLFSGPLSRDVPEGFRRFLNVVVTEKVSVFVETDSAPARWRFRVHFRPLAVVQTSKAPRNV